MMANVASVSGLLRTAVSEHRSGRHQMARESCAMGLIMEPAHIDLLNLIGLTHHALDERDLAGSFIDRALTAAPLDHNSLTHKAMLTATPSQSAATIRKNCLTRPGYPAGYTNLGRIVGPNDPDGFARAAFAKALVLAPSDWATRSDLAKSHLDSGDVSSAARLIREAPQTSHIPSDVFYLLGRIRKAQGKRTEALHLFEKAAIASPVDAEIRLEIADLNAKDNPGRSVDHLRTAIIHQPTIAKVLSTLSSHQYDTADMQAAIRSARRATICDPFLENAWHNLGKICSFTNIRNKTVDYAARASILNPGNDEVGYSAAILNLAVGDLDTGWRWFGRRSLTRKWLHIDLPHALFQSTPNTLSGRRPLIAAEQGLGDEILFSGCFQDLENALETGLLDHVVIECDERLINLFSRSFPSIHFIPRLKTGNADEAQKYYASIVSEHQVDQVILAGSLPGIYRKRLEDFPHHSGWMVPDERSSIDNASRSDRTGKLVGISWRSLSGRQGQGPYYPEINDFAHVLKAQDIQWVSLQYDAPEQDIRHLEDLSGKPVLAPDGLDMMNDIDGVASLIHKLDLVITVPNTVYALAGAVGTGCLTVSSGYPWAQLGTAGHPFFPSVDFICKGADRTWSDVMEETRKMLETGMNTASA